MYTLFGKENLKIYCQNIVIFGQQLVETIAICSEQLAHQYCNIVSQCCNVAGKITSDLVVIIVYICKSQIHEQ